MKKIPSWMILALGGLVFLALLMRLQAPPATALEVPYSTFKTMIAEDRVTEILLEGDKATALLDKPMAIVPGGPERDRVESYLPAVGDPELLPLIESKKIILQSRPAKDGGSFLIEYLVDCYHSA